MDIQGKTVIVTGGGGGIGSAAACVLAARGASIVLVDRNEGAMAAVLDRLTPGRHRSMNVDVGDAKAAAGVFDVLDGDGAQLVGVVNAAGIVSGGSPWPASDLGRMVSVVAINTAGTVLFSTLAARRPDQRGMVVVNVASAAAIRPHAPDPAYAASKAGVVAFTRSAAAAAVPGLRVNAVLPGVVRTPMLNDTGEDGVAPWLAPRLQHQLLSPEQVAETIEEFVVGDQNGEIWSLELDKANPGRVLRSSL
ncbi:SDR family NAD(P)-dependent oxidoreductase [Mycobacterium sp. AZCC_0083]|uniref:SDR family NAD(P)-dependent oxidoreductase n=1 Tax=Mycobacterium sp. AZCC_0083 TaxID=2735882 RepID=UPI001616FDE2|nr:SDR family NAD(P)-dependent oxidoreductase [Mycobacterium sp. AZCC_0083]MBB5164018.1 NAD(P)-dependent dehydrogenase (short-subunit alcohol dehydrogenase family) [Mycobacterium sp. AZCC_0083]